MKLKLVSEYTPTGDQPQAIDALIKGLNKPLHEQVLLGVTGSGKTFTLANVIEKTQLPTLVISHNKTLAAQLYQEFKSFFPQNAVSYFVSYYDYYQPEAYIPQTDTYIEKETEINEEIDKLRLAATANILTRQDVVVVASVSCIYNIGSPKEYGGFVLELRPGVEVSRESILARLVELQYERSDFGFHRGTFRVRGDVIDIFPAYENHGVRLEMNLKGVQSIATFDPMTGKTGEAMSAFVLYPAKHFMTDTKKDGVFKQIEDDLAKQVKLLKQKDKLLEAHRLEQKVNFDLEMIREVGYVNGIENYSRYFDGRNPGDPPFSLLDYYQEAYGDNWLLCIDESHMTIPQVRGMFHGDLSRKQTLIDFGFRLPAALDNRPLRFDEFVRRTPSTIYVSATPADWEIKRAQEEAKRVYSSSDPALTRNTKDRRENREASLNEDSSRLANARSNNKIHSGVVEQLIRPTGLVDPQIQIRPVTTQIADLMKEIKLRLSKHERTLVTTLTKRTAEDLSNFLDEQGINVHYLHADVHTLERSSILDDLRRGVFDVVVGINLLREGLDLPEVSLVAILDADKEGFLRSRVSLIQTMGRAARHAHGEVIMYADKTTDSMKAAISEVTRRRQIQLDYNTAHHITPTTIHKPIREKMTQETPEVTDLLNDRFKKDNAYQMQIDPQNLTPADRNKLIKQLEKEMQTQAAELNFERAAQIRDRILLLKGK